MKGVEVTDEMMDAVGDMQLVESVTLLSGGPDNGFTCEHGNTSSPARRRLTPDALASRSRARPGT